ncbi:MAG: DUF2157 domain-containing protein [Planctomycetota bacterium]
MADTPASFRKRLKEELALWQQEGLVSPNAASKLIARYGLDAIGGETANYLITAIYIIGALLIGGGVISLVASHWEQMGPAFKLVLIIGAMLAAYTGGYHYWKVSCRRPRLGHALVVLGTLIFGANIGLVAQIFHIQSNFYNGFAAWAVGAAAVGYAAVSTPVMTIAIVTSFIYFAGWSMDNPDRFAWYTLAAGALLLPYAYLWNSAWTAFLTALVIGIALLVTGGTGGEFMGFALASVTAASLLYAWGLLHKSLTRMPGLEGALKFLGALTLCLAAYLCSFGDMARDLRFHSWHADRYGWAWTRSLGIAAAVSIGLWVAAIGRQVRGATAGGPATTGHLLKTVFSQVDLTFAAGLVLFLATVLVQLDGLAMTLANVTCLILAAGFIRAAFVTLDRRPFWSGLLLLALVIVSRFFEWDTDLMLKALVLIVTGIGVLVGGVAFEKHLKAGRPTPPVQGGIQ